MEQMEALVEEVDLVHHIILAGQHLHLVKVTLVAMAKMELLMELAEVVEVLVQ
jgi:hypothetical protein